MDSSLNVHVSGCHDNWYVVDGIIETLTINRTLLPS